MINSRADLKDNINEILFIMIIRGHSASLNQHHDECECSRCGLTIPILEEIIDCCSCTPFKINFNL
jgi:hypothetical protein